MIGVCLQLFGFQQDNRGVNPHGIKVRLHGPTSNVPISQKRKYYEDPKTPFDTKAFTATLREELTRHLKALDMGMPTNSKVKIVRNKNLRSPPPAELQASKLHLLQRRGQTNRQSQGRIKTAEVSVHSSRHVLAGLNHGFIDISVECIHRSLHWVSRPSHRHRSNIPG